MTEVVIDRRFCGPKRSGNGGYSAGLFAQVIEGPAAVTLKSPPPLDTPITLRSADGDAYEAVIDDRTIASVEPAAVTIEPPNLPDDDAIRAAHDAFLTDTEGEHLIPYCFVCGNRRAAGDGLRLFTGPAPSSQVNADFWTPGADLAGGDGLVRPEFLWAALDCPSAFALRLWPRLTLLGRHTAEIHRRPKPGERLIAAAWADGSAGRKHYASAVLLDAGREIIAAANALWVELAADSPLLAQLKADRSE